MKPSDPRRLRRSQAILLAEALESRSLMTGGAGNTIALTPATVANPNGSATVPFTVSVSNFTAPKGKLTLGVDVAAPNGSQIHPKIRGIEEAPADAAEASPRSHGGPRQPRLAMIRTPGSTAVLTTVHLADKAGQKASYQATVSALDKTSGRFLLGFYLPGDANGDGVVDQADLQAIRAALGSKVGDDRYNFDADANRDGKINRIDLQYAQKNQGAKTTISPVVTADLDPDSDSGLKDRVTVFPTVHFTGQGTPGATITYSEVNHKAPDVSTTVDEAGHYSLNVALGQGSNTFQVTSVDPFGQTISGTISPVTYMPALVGLPVPTVAPTTTTTSTAASPPPANPPTTSSPSSTPTTPGDPAPASTPTPQVAGALGKKQTPKRATPAAAAHPALQQRLDRLAQSLKLPKMPDISKWKI
ncbi:MAG: hypothetical protein IRY99_00635 [Isosphaeraceae bacterium]|nr:hypothetical protein [Isosphaeraceae bacterium]